MTWEEFLVVTAYHCELKGAVQEFFIQVLSDETYLDLSSEKIADQAGVEIKTCEAHLSAIYKKVGQGTLQRFSSRQTIRQLRQLHSRLKNELRQREFEQFIQAEARSQIPCSLDEQFHLHLRHFNYKRQERCFLDTLMADQAAQIVLVRIDNLALQKWLVWRLVQRFQDIDGIETEKAHQLSVTATRKWAAEPEIFWQWLAKRLGCDKATPEQVLDTIASTCQSRSVIIAIHEAGQIKPRVWEYFLKDFWQPLSQRLNSEACGIQRRRCLLFLTEHAEYTCSQPISGLTELAPWRMVELREDWQPWLRNVQVQEFLKQKADLSDWLSMRLDKPEVVIKGIGQEFELQDGIEAMVRHWNLETA